MTTPSIVPAIYTATDADYYHAPGRKDGAIQPVIGEVTIPSGTVHTTVVGLFPFQKGASFHVSSASFHCGNWGGGSTTVDLGIVYDDDSGNTNDVDLFVAASTAPQSGGFVTVGNVAYVNYVTTANGWVVATINTAAADATEDISFNVGVSYGSKVVE